MIYGVDVHTEYQAGLNIESLKAEGFDFCIVKATQGSNGYWAPDTFDNWQSRIRASGMINGAYHWCTNSSLPSDQVDYFLSRIGDHTQYPMIQLDISTVTDINMVRGWVQWWNRRTNNHPLFLYPEKPTTLRYSDLLALGMLWDSHYVAGSGFASVLYESVPSGWWDSGATILQFTSKATAGGLTANVDANVFQGSKQDLLRIVKGEIVSSWDVRGLEPAPPNFPYNGPVASVDVHSVLRTGDQTGWSKTDGGGWWIVKILRAILEKVSQPVQVSIALSDADRDDIATKVTSKLLAQLTLVQKGQ